ncbi:MAG: DUF1080 domain-containing protein [Candidatus Binatia bacterium]
MTLLTDSDLVDLTVGAPPADASRLERLADALSAWTGRATRTATDRWEWLFDGGGAARWRVAGAGGFVVVGDRLESVPGDDLGLFWCTIPTPANFVLRLEWLRWRHEDNSGVFVRFPEPCAGPHGNPAFTAIQRGFEVQLDEVGVAGATAIHRTGAIFDQPDQRLQAPIVRPPAEWNEVEIAVSGQRYRVRINGAPTCELDNRDPSRGLAGTAEAPSFVGLQVCPGSRVAFRRIRLRAL